MKLESGWWEATLQLRLQTVFVKETPDELKRLWGSRVQDCVCLVFRAWGDGCTVFVAMRFCDAPVMYCLCNAISRRTSLVFSGPRHVN